MDRRLLLKWLTGFTTGVLLSCQTSAKGQKESKDRLGDLLPLRQLGRTGEAVTMLGLGGWHIGKMSERDAQETIEDSLAAGVRFFDTAESYQAGGSETRLGKLLVPKYRDVVFLMTKTTAPDAETARRHLEESLRRLSSDYLDLWQVHALESPEDVDDRIANGLLDVMREAKASGKVRYIGFTGHTRPSAHKQMLLKTDIFDTCQMPVNLADPSYQSFVKNVMPELVQRDIGILAMKTLANGGFFGGSQHGEHGNNPKVVPERVSVAEAIAFAWSLPISVLITGPDNPGQMKEKISLARSFENISELQRQKLIEKVADLAGRQVEFYKA